jgi:hypothetical protein
MDVSERLATLQGEAENLRSALAAMNQDAPVPAALTGRLEDLEEDMATLKASL